VKFHKYIQDFRATPSCPAALEIWNYAKIRQQLFWVDFDDQAHFWKWLSHISGQALQWSIYYHGGIFVP
jgi:hypothetical protein